MPATGARRPVKQEELDVSHACAVLNAQTLEMNVLLEKERWFAFNGVVDALMGYLCALAHMVDAVLSSIVIGVLVLVAAIFVVVLNGWILLDAKSVHRTAVSSLKALGLAMPLVL